MQISLKFIKLITAFSPVSHGDTTPLVPAFLSADADLPPIDANDFYSPYDSDDAPDENDSEVLNSVSFILGLKYFIHVESYLKFKSKSKFQTTHFKILN